MIRDETWIKIIHEPIGTIVQCQTKNRHIIGIHHTMCPAHGLPMCNHHSSSSRYFRKKPRVFISVVNQMRKVLGNHIIGQSFEMFMLPPIEEHFKASKPHMTRRHANEHRPRLWPFAQHALITANNTERARGGNAQPMHGLPTQIFANRGS